MGAFAVVDDYRLNESGLYIRSHAIILVNGHKEPPIKTEVYPMSNSEKECNKIVANFLERYISKYYDLYATDKYCSQYSEPIASLRHKFLTKKLNEAPDVLKTHATPPIHAAPY